MNDEKAPEELVIAERLPIMPDRENSMSVRRASSKITHANYKLIGLQLTKKQQRNDFLLMTLNLCSKM